MITIGYAYYDNPEMLGMHCATWSGYPQGFEIIIVDDASPNSPAINVLQDYPHLPISLYRVKQNIPWNQNGARNLIMQQCSTEWALLLDMDHLLEKESAQAVLNMAKNPDKYYVPRRVWPDGSEHRRHPNSYLLTREKFFESGGYDEDFCGYYGSDGTFRRALDVVAERVETDEFETVLYEGILDDANTREFGRKNTKYYAALNPVLAAKRASGAYKAVNPIRFEWEKLL